MIDTHCHLTEPRLASQLKDVLARAAGAGVDRLITIGTDLEDDRRCVATCAGRPRVRCAIGVHPTHVAGVQEDQLDQLGQMQSDPAVVALGEMGLDYHRGTELRDRQIRFFRHQLALAVEVNKPVVIHCREAFADCLAILNDFPTVAAIFHCFTGTAAEARTVLERGYLIGFTGVVTFKNSGELAEVARLAPADRIVVETDAPWLAPEPMRRHKTNEPAWVIHTAAVVARLRGLTLEELDAITTANAERFFGWGKTLSAT
jgi:TatD DNase family protein